MIILRQKNYTAAVERVMAKEALRKVGKREVPDMHVLPLKYRAKIEKTKRKIVNSGVDVINNPIGAAADLGKDLITRPMNTAGKIAIGVPFPASVPAGAAAIYIGNQLNKRVKPLKLLSDKLRNKIENSKVYKKVKGVNLHLLKHPYKDKDKNND